MAAYYPTHDNSSTTNNNTAAAPQIPENANNNLHTLILMQHQHQQQQSNNILLLNSAAAAAAFAQPPPQFHNQNITLYGYPQEDARDLTRARQGLSLSLSSQNPALLNPTDDDAGGGQVSVLGSKYLRATQELLEEVVNVGDNSNGGPKTTTDSQKGKDVGDTPSEDKDKQSGGGGGAQLSTSERQEIQMKKAKLVSMLDEAEQRYKHYNNQMQMVIESFERAAGMGSAKTYTALALKTISKQFRCLKDAIQAQIRVANKSLGEDDGGSSAAKIQGSRLKFIDHQIRQQRALQQLGMIQNHNAWRPQRGLPERSVSVLRAWLFEHFLHPYPKDSDKILLAKQTGLTRSQVSNWFINARVRLWKPMIEEMYNEELKDHEHEHEQDISEDKENSNEEMDGGSISMIQHQQEKFNNNNINNSGGDQTPHQVVRGSQQLLDNHNNDSSSGYHQHRFTLTAGSLEMEGISQGSPKRQRNNQQGGEMMIKFGNEDDDKEEEGNTTGYPMISSSGGGGGMNFMGGGELGIGSYPMSDLGRFETEDFPAPRFVQANNGGISLSLGVGLPPSRETNHHHHHHHHHHQPQHFNNHSFMSSDQNIPFPRGNDFGSIDIQSRKGFAAQLLPDFVA